MTLDGVWLWGRLTGGMLAALLLLAARPATALGVLGDEGWTRQFGTEKDDPTLALAASSQGVYVGGGMSDEPPAASSRAFLRKYTADGEAAWTRWYVPPGEGDLAAIESLATDRTGVYAVGGVVECAADNCANDGFVLKYSHDGTLLWERRIRARYGAIARAVAADASGLYVAGSTHDSGDPDNMVGFVHKYNQAGKLSWVRQFDWRAFEVGEDQISDFGGAHIWVRGLDVGPDGVYAVGELPVRDTSGDGRTDTDSFVRKFTPDGRVVWSRQFSAAGSTEARTVAVADTTVYVAGVSEGASPGQMYDEEWDGFVRQYDATGRVRWTRQLGPVDDADADHTGVYLVGGGGEKYLSALRDDVFVRKYRSDGRVAWTRHFGTDEPDSGTGIRVGAPGDTRQASEVPLYVAGETEGSFGHQRSRGGGDGYLLRYPQAGSVPAAMPHTGGGGIAQR